MQRLSVVSLKIESKKLILKALKQPTDPDQIAFILFGSPANQKQKHFVVQLFCSVMVMMV